MGAKTILSLLIVALLVYKFANVLPNQTGTCRSAGECIDLAIESDDPTQCDVLKGLKAELCRLNYYVHISDIELCNTLENSEYASQCARQIAEDFGDLSLCEQVSDTTIRGLCVIDLATSISDCNRLGSISAEVISCYASVADKRREVGVCFELPRNVRLSDGRPIDPPARCCDLIRSPDLKDDCLEGLPRRK